MIISIEVKDSHLSIEIECIKYSLDVIYIYGNSYSKFRSNHSKDELIEIKEQIIKAASDLDDFIKKIED